MLGEHRHGLCWRTWITQKCCHCNSKMFHSVFVPFLWCLYTKALFRCVLSAYLHLQFLLNSSQKRKNIMRWEETLIFSERSTWSKKDINHYHFLSFTWDWFLHLYIPMELNVAAGDVRQEPWLWRSTHRLYSNTQKESPLSCSSLLSCYGTLSPPL